MKYFFLFIMLSFFSCKQLQKKVFADADVISSPVIIEANNHSLIFKNGFWYYGENLFSGTIIDRFSDKTVHQKKTYTSGKENGLQLIYFPGGELSEKRYYTNGEKDKVHTGWWENGNLRFEYHFANGIYNGDYKEWYQSGKLLKHIHYVKGIDDCGKGWRETGKLYMNYIMKNGRRYGIVNSNLCYTVKNGNGEFVVSVGNENSK